MEVTDEQVKTEFVLAPENETTPTEVTDKALLDRNLYEITRNAETLIVPENSHLGQAINLLQKEVGEDSSIEHGIQVQNFISSDWRNGPPSTLRLSEMVHGSETQIDFGISGATISADLHSHPNKSEDSFFSPKDVDTTLILRSECSILLLPGDEGDEIIMLTNDTSRSPEKNKQLREDVRKIAADYTDELVAIANRITNMPEATEQEMHDAFEKYFDLREKSIQELFNFLLSEDFGLFVSVDGKNFARIKPLKSNS